MVEVDQEKTLSKKVSASHVFVAVLNNHYVEETISGTLTVRKMLDFTLKGTKFSYIFKDKESEFKSVEQENFGDKFANELISEIVEDYGLELDVDNYKIYVYKKMGKRINHTLDSRYNMPGIKIKTSTDGCSTRARGYGAIKENSSTDSKKRSTSLSRSFTSTLTKISSCLMACRGGLSHCATSVIKKSPA